MNCFATHFVFLSASRQVFLPSINARQCNEILFVFPHPQIHTSRKLGRIRGPVEQMWSLFRSISPSYEGNDALGARRVIIYLFIIEREAHKCLLQCEVGRNLYFQMVTLHIFHPEKEVQRHKNYIVFLHHGFFKVGVSSFFKKELKTIYCSPLHLEGIK